MMNGVSQKGEVTTVISYVGAVPEFKKSKTFCLKAILFSNVLVTLNV